MISCHQITSKTHRKYKAIFNYLLIQFVYDSECYLLNSNMKLGESACAKILTEDGREYYMPESVTEVYLGREAK